MAHSPTSTVTTRHAVDASPFVSNQAVIAVEHHIPTTDYDRMRREFLRFIETAPLDWEAGTCVRKLHMFDEVISCVMWEGRFFITGTDIVRALVWRFRLEGQLIGDRKKFEEGVFSDLRNLKPGTDATLEEPRSRFLDYLYKLNCIRTHKKQKVFFWFSVPHEKLFQDAIRREKKREIYPIVDTLLSLGVDSARDSRVADNLRSLFDARRGFPVEPVDTSSSGLVSSSLPAVTDIATAGRAPLLPSPVSLLSTPRSATSAGNHAGNPLFFPLTSPSSLQGFSMMTVGDQPSVSQQQQPFQDTRAASPYSTIFGGNRAVAIPNSVGGNIVPSNDGTNPTATPSFEFPFIIPPQHVANEAQPVANEQHVTSTASMTPVAAAQRLQYVSSGGLLSPISPSSAKRDARGNFSFHHHPGLSPITPNSAQPNTLAILMNEDEAGDDVEDDVSDQVAPTLPLPPLERPRGRMRRRRRLSGAVSPPPEMVEGKQPGDHGDAADVEDNGEEEEEMDEEGEEEDENDDMDDEDDMEQESRGQVDVNSMPADVSMGSYGARNVNHGLLRGGSSGSTTPLGSLPSPSPYFMNITGAPNIYSPIAAIPPSGSASSLPFSSYMPMVAPSGRRRAPYHCPHPMCGREFKRFQHLKRHQLTHSGEKPFRCPDPRCARAFARSDNLAQHIRTHQAAGGSGGGGVADSSTDEGETPPFEISAEQQQQQDAEEDEEVEQVELKLEDENPMQEAPIQKDSNFVEGLVLKG